MQSSQPTLLHQVIVYAVTIGLSLYLLGQVRKPDRFAGRFFLWAMNKYHSPVTTWGLSHVTIAKGFAILDIGCGGGATVSKLAAIATEGSVTGVDYADGSVAASRRRNARLIDVGRVTIQKASVSRLPFADATFDLATAVETHYYWPDLVKDCGEVRRVLKPGGTFVMIAESYSGGGRFSAVERVVMKPMRSTQLSADEHRDVLVKAGFADVQVFENRRRGWICVTGVAR